MASRTKQKEEARARRMAEEQARQERERRTRRLQMLGGLVGVAVVVVIVAIAIGASGGSSSPPKLTSPAATSAANTVNGELSGIQQSGNVIGSPSAPVTVTEYGDLKCPVCKEFALNGENQLIANEVRSGKVKLAYKSLCTATCSGPQPSIFPTQQAAALAAGKQNKLWNYVLLFYHLQGDETTSYVDDNFLNGLATKIPGLNYSQWSSDRGSSALTAQVTADQNAANAAGYQSTPTIVVQGPKGQAQPIVGAADYGTLQSAIKSVS
jgi:protein-disulfide isomerase